VRVLVTMRKAIAYDAAVHANPDRAALGQLGSPAHVNLSANWLRDPTRQDDRHQHARSNVDNNDDDDEDDDDDDDDNDNDDNDE
jgi:hypothetical protein